MTTGSRTTYTSNNNNSGDSKMYENHAHTFSVYKKKNKTFKFVGA
jgi:hypothetical protein